MKHMHPFKQNNKLAVATTAATQNRLAARQVSFRTVIGGKMLANLLLLSLLLLVTSSRQAVLAQTYSCPTMSISPEYKSVPATSSTFSMEGSSFGIDACYAYFSRPEVAWLRFNGAGKSKPYLQQGFAADVNPSDSARATLIRLTSRFALVVQAGQKTNYSVISLSHLRISLFGTPEASTGSFNAAGGEELINVQAQPNASWRVETVPDWIRLTSAGSGTGSGRFNYQVQPNSQITPRGAVFKVGDSFIAITQAGSLYPTDIGPGPASPPLLRPGCRSVGFSPSSLNFPASSPTPQTISISSLPADCGWNTTPSTSWITASANLDQRTVTVSVTPNLSTSARPGSVLIGSSYLQVTQAGLPILPCSFSVGVEPSSLSFTKDGGSRSVKVTVSNPACQWSINGAPEWIQFARSSGQGTQILSCNVLANPTAQARTAAVNIAGTTLVFSQQAGNPPPCNISVSSSSLTLGGAGASAVLTVSTSFTPCAWSVRNDASWLTVTPNNGSNSQAVTVTATANEGPASRRVTLTIGGQSIQVVQDVKPLPLANAYDVVTIQQSGTASGGTELSSLSATANYNSFAAKALVIGFAQTGKNWAFQLADWDRDGRLDLIGIFKNGTGSGKTEVHILSGASGFTQFILHVATPLEQTFDNWEFVVGDWDRDLLPDLIGVKKQGTGSGTTEVHILSGASQFTQFSLHAGTALVPSGANSTFALGDWDRDGRLDLFLILKSGTGSGTTEVHILSGSSNFARFLLQTRTGFQQTDNRWEFIVADWDRDGRPDLIGVAKQATGSETTELHILSGSSNFGQFILHTRTALSEVGSEYQFIGLGKLK